MPAGLAGGLRPGEILGGPDHEVRGADPDLLLATGATVGLAGTGARDAPDKEVTFVGADRLPSAQRYGGIITALARYGALATVGATATQGTMGTTGHSTTVSRRDRCPAVGALLSSTG